MVTTAYDLCQSAVEEIGVYAPGEVMSDADAQRVLKQLNKMMDSWSNESLTCYAILEQTGFLQVGQQSYLIGPGAADFNMPRPLRIIIGPGAARIRDVNANDYDIEVIPEDKWNLIGLKSSTSDIPNTLFYDPQFPLGIINIFPVPLINYQIFWDSYLPLTTFTDLTSVLTLPPGYEEAISRNLAISIKPFFPSSVLDDATVLLAALGKGNIKRTNIRENVAQFDQYIVSKTTPTYNIYRDRTGT